MNPSKRVIWLQSHEMIRRSLIIAACVRRMTASTNRKKRRKISARHREVVKNVTEDFLSFQSTPDPNKRKIGRGKNKKKGQQKRRPSGARWQETNESLELYTHDINSFFFEYTEFTTKKMCVALHSHAMEQNSSNYSLFNAHLPCFILFYSTFVIQVLIPSVFKYKHLKAFYTKLYYAFKFICENCNFF